MSISERQIPKLKTTTNKDAVVVHSPGISLAKNRPNGRFIAIEGFKKAFVVADIHGCLHTFKALLEEIDFKGQYPLFLLGDLINKGPYSTQTLDFVLRLCEHHASVYPLKGNHELYLLNYLTREDSEWKHSSQYRQMKQSGDYEKLSSERREKYITFIESLPYFYETENFFIVHAGFNFLLDDVFADKNAMLTIRGFEYQGSKVSGKTVVHGHFPKKLTVIREAIDRKLKVVPLDNGCVYEGDKSGMGNLCCLELKAMKLYQRKNEDLV